MTEDERDAANMASLSRVGHLSLDAWALETEHLREKVKQQQAALNSVWLAAGRPVPREQLVVAVRQWREERDRLIRAVRTAKARLVEARAKFAEAGELFEDVRQTLAEGSP